MKVTGSSGCDERQIRLVLFKCFQRRWGAYQKDTSAEELEQKKSWNSRNDNIISVALSYPFRFIATYGATNSKTKNYEIKTINNAICNFVTISNILFDIHYKEEKDDRQERERYPTTTRIPTSTISSVKTIKLKTNKQIKNFAWDKAED